MGGQYAKDVSEPEEIASVGQICREAHEGCPLYQCVTEPKPTSLQTCAGDSNARVS